MLAPAWHDAQLAITKQIPNGDKRDQPTNSHATISVHCVVTCLHLHRNPIDLHASHTWAKWFGTESVILFFVSLFNSKPDLHHSDRY